MGFLHGLITGGGGGLITSEEFLFENGKQDVKESLIFKLHVYYYKLEQCYFLEKHHYKLLLALFICLPLKKKRT